MRFRVLTMLLAALLVLPLAAEAQKPIKVGYPMIMSGPGALFGEPAAKGAQMFVDEINAKGGVLGLFGIVNPRRRVDAADCPGGQLAGVPREAAGCPPGNEAARAA